MLASNDTLDETPIPGSQIISAKSAVTEVGNSHETSDPIEGSLNERRRQHIGKKLKERVEEIKQAEPVIPTPPVSDTNYQPRFNQYG